MRTGDQQERSFLHGANLRPCDSSYTNGDTGVSGVFANDETSKSTSHDDGVQVLPHNLPRTHYKARPTSHSGLR
jgi:hypothetical protein